MHYDAPVGQWSLVTVAILGNIRKLMEWGPAKGSGFQGYVLCPILSHLLFPAQHEVNIFAQPYDPTMILSLPVGPKQQNHGTID